MDGLIPKDFVNLHVLLPRDPRCPAEESRRMARFPTDLLVLKSSCLENICRTALSTRQNLTTSSDLQSRCTEQDGYLSALADPASVGPSDADYGVLMSNHFTEEQLSFCRTLPKVELHAHLNGSLRDSTIRELAEQKSLDPALTRVLEKGDRTLSEVFQVFGVIHQVTTDHAILTRITQEVIEDFAADNVQYLELRTTPKDRPEHGMTKRSYCKAVLRGVQQAREGGCQTVVRILLSIDRREDAVAAMQTVQLAAELGRQGVVGIDLSGNPSIGQWATWEPALVHARTLGLKLTLHAAEVYNPKETKQILDFRPDRLGHMCCLDDALEKQFYDSCIPVELCLSSNIITESVASFPDHHFLPFFRAGHPVVLCTDDSGVFNTSLSQEYAIAAQAFGLSHDDLWELSLQAVEHAFLSDNEKEELRQRWVQQPAS